ncbi:hypothetical protein CCH79_00009928 [Gambusia affinis]|uniref:Uncharacterized protein n=1 Tax=Gambusia affinis TaxID=33528 RepID=A0A315V549_GAMAF|nr:hypothetical protein CCH79_00009928 [Gambusia affinis]
MPYTPQCAHISSKLRSKILQGQYVNLASILLPSPEVDQRIASSENFTAILKTSDPRLSKDLSIGQFLAAFSVYRDSAFYPSLPFKPSTSASPLPQPLINLGQHDRSGRKVQPLLRCSSEVSMSPLSIPHQKPLRFQELVYHYLSTPILVPELASLLLYYPDHTLINFLISGLSQGFQIGGPHFFAAPFVLPNLHSVLNEPNVVSQLLSKKISKGYIIGPFVFPPFPFFRVNPLGVATRKYSGKNRLILDLSAPHSGPPFIINSLIPKPPISLYYATVDQTISLIKSARLAHGWLRLTLPMPSRSYLYIPLSGTF